MPDAKDKIKETDLSAPVKAFLESLGYEVKAEVGAADLMGIKAGEAPCFVELKTSFSLALLHQGVARLSLSDQVYVAVPHKAGRTSWKALKANIKLARRLGLGVLTVKLETGAVQVRCHPASYVPRKNKRKLSRLTREFERREGDPNLGGITQTKIITAYRQEAEKLRVYLGEHGPTKASVLAAALNIKRARDILYINHYGWFERQGKGVYSLTSQAQEAA